MAPTATARTGSVMFRSMIAMRRSRRGGSSSTGSSFPMKVDLLAHGPFRGQRHQPMHRKPALFQTGHHLLPHGAGGPHYCDCICSTHLFISWV